MNKQEIFSKLNSSGLDKGKIIVLSGASLVVQDIISSTSDIDFSCDKTYYNKVDWPIKIGAFGVEIKYNDIYEIGENLYYPNDVVIIDGYKFLNLEKCLEVKKALHRDKDKDVIQKLEKALKNRFLIN